MTKYTFTWKTRFPLNRPCTERLCRWTIFNLNTFVNFLDPSARSAYSFFGFCARNFRLSRSGRLIARSATYQGV